MAAITIRDIPDEVREELTARAVRSGKTLEKYLLDELVFLALVPSSDDVLERARVRADRGDTDVSADEIVAIIRELRGE